jgi:hypothetical protein
MIKMENNTVMVFQTDLTFMEDFLQAELDEITFEVDQLIELAQQKAEKLKRVREMMDEFTDMVEEIE